ncbi:WD40 repeat domain-containing protein [Leptolyngbyaceae cyanobacterium UHCC 1019]
MLKDLIRIQLSTKEITYQPGGIPATFEIAVVNQSDQFASFQLDIQAAGVESYGNPYWYVVSPDISTKNPPGDRTQFSVQIIDNPKPGFVGLMNLTVRIFSMDLRQEERQILRLILQPGTAYVPLKIALPVRTFQAQPDELIEIPVELENPEHLVAEAIVRCVGIPLSWLTEGAERRLKLTPDGKAKTSFLCRIPNLTEAPCQTYGFSVEANRVNEPTSVASGSLYVLPVGRVEVRCPYPQQQMPPQGAGLPNWKKTQVIYPLYFTNHSNLPHQVAIAVQPQDNQAKCHLEIIPDQAELPMNQSTQLDLWVTKRRRWVGFPQTCLFETKARLADARLDVHNDTQLLRLILHPVFPIWLQALGVLGVLWLLWWLSWLNPANPYWGHKAPLNSVQFNGVGDKIISGADDQAILGWRTDGFENPLINEHTGTIAKTQKAVRVVRFRPINNDLVAAGLENGEIQLWNATVGDREPLHTFLRQPDDRVFDLAFTPDSRTLFSGHGSGLVVQWSLDPNIASIQPIQQRQKQMGFAVNALKLVGEAGSHLAIAGRFNQLVLWDLKKDTVRSIKYGTSGEANYILSLATAAAQPYLLASADNQGTIKIWNLRACLNSTLDCPVVDEWKLDKAVHSVAFSADGCYLASAGEDGRAILWSLTTSGDRWGQAISGQVLDQSSKSINSVDVIRSKDDILIVTGGDDTEVNLYRVKQSNSDCR